MLYYFSLCCLEIFENLLKTNVKEDQFEQAYAIFDSNKNLQIDLSEFSKVIDSTVEKEQRAGIVLLNQLGRYILKRGLSLTKLFDTFDRNKDGNLSKQEMKSNFFFFSFCSICLFGGELLPH